MSILKNFIRNFVEGFKGRELVGVDHLGNSYFRYFEYEDGLKIERREANPKGLHVAYDPNKIPSQWRMWIRKQRPDPPTPEEMTQALLKAEEMKVRVAALDEAERQRRLRMQAAGADVRAAEAEPNMEQFLSHMAKQNAPSAAQGNASPQDPSSVPQPGSEKA